MMPFAQPNNPCHPKCSERYPQSHAVHPNPITLVIPNAVRDLQSASSAPELRANGIDCRHTVEMMAEFNR
jgi:hypothetical protein